MRSSPLGSLREFSIAYPAFFERGPRSCTDRQIGIVALATAGLFGSRDLRDSGTRWEVAATAVLSQLSALDQRGLFFDIGSLTLESRPTAPWHLEIRPAGSYSDPPSPYELSLQRAARPDTAVRQRSWISLVPFSLRQVAFYCVRRFSLARIPASSLEPERLGASLRPLIETVFSHRGSFAAALVGAALAVLVSDCVKAGRRELSHSAEGEEIGATPGIWRLVMSRPGMLHAGAPAKHAVRQANPALKPAR